MPTLIEAILALIAGAMTFLAIFTSKGQEAGKWLLRNLIRANSVVGPELAKELSPGLAELLKTFIEQVNLVGPPLVAQLKPVFDAMAAQNFTALSDLLKGEGESTPEKAVLSAAVAIGQAYGNGASSAGVTALFETIFPEKLNTLNAAGPLFASLAGFEEIADAVRKPLYESAFGKSLQYHYRSIFRPELPDEFDAVLWHARGLLTDDQLRKVFHYSGLKSEYEDPYVKSAYRSISPFIMIRMMETGIFSDADTREELTFTGLRPLSQSRAITAAAEMALAPYKQKVVSAVVKAFERGTLAEPDFDSQLNALNLPPGAPALLKLEAHYLKLEQLLEIYRKQVTVLYETNQMTDAEYVPTLEAAGIAQADAEAHYGVDSARLKGKILLAEERAAAAAARRLQAVEVRAAEEDFMVHRIDEAALAAALTVAGLPLAMVPLLVGIFVARRDATQVYLFGKLIARKDAPLLREQVAAVEEQTLKKLISPAQARQELLNLGIPAANAEALAARWAAQADKVILPI